MRKKLLTGSLLIVLLIAVGCSKDKDDVYVNPYDDPSLLPPKDTTKQVNLEPGSFQYMYHYIFNETCANSGCHDGTFEPDFRTTYSAYNTLVNHPVIKNNASNSFTYRVEPGNDASSVIIERLTNDIDGQSGIMPLSVEPDSDWPEKKDEYIQMIRDWILAGAPDTYGNLPSTQNGPPQVIGMMAFKSGTTTTPLLREGDKKNKPVLITNDPVDIWFAFADDQTDPNNFVMTSMKSSKELYDFSASSFEIMNKGATVAGNDFWDQPVTFTHKVTVSFPTDTIGTYIFLRTYLRDGEQPDTTEAPNDGSNSIIRSYFTLKVDSL